MLPFLQLWTQYAKQKSTENTKNNQLFVGDKERLNRPQLSDLPIKHKSGSALI